MTDNRILDYINSPARVRQLSVYQMELLAQEIREQLISTVSKTGGHLASNLGVVELTVALLHSLRPPEDKIVWDVGHQCYPYKLLTGRRARFDTLRQENGISGFPKSAESPCDSFLSGHASTSLAVAYGLRRALTLRRQPGTVAAVIGDGSLTGGMAFEGLNNIGKSGENILVILNDNEMAISRNEGALARYLSVIRSRPGYFKVKKLTEAALRGIPVVGKPLRDVVAQSKTSLKQLIYPSTFFEELGFTYFGPVDGHNIRSLCDVFCEAQTINRPAFIHVKTQKGRGYRFAEENPGAFHGIAHFDIDTGACSPASISFSSVFGEELTALAKKDKRICAVTAAMEQGTGLTPFSQAFSGQGRHYDVGIAEEFGVTFSSALAAGGMLPVFAVYSTFLQRGYDQLLHDAAIERRHLVLGIDRAGIVGDDGETHQGIFDAAFLSTIPGFTLFSPANYAELRAMLRQALYACDGPVGVRYPRGSEDAYTAQYAPSGAPFDLISGGNQCLLVTYGRSFAAAKTASDQSAGRASVLKLNRVLPLDESAVRAALGYERVIFVEEGISGGGVGMQFLARLSLLGYRGRTSLRAIDAFVPQCDAGSALRRLGLDADGILSLING